MTAVTNSNVIKEREERLKSEFSRFSNWEERYKHIIDLGKALPPLPQELYDEKYKVRGCQSQVWLHAELTPEKKVRFKGDSDALIVKGLIAVLLNVYSDATPEEILSSSPQFLKDIGLEGHLSPSRANGLYAMVRQIHYYAKAFQALAALGRN